MADPLHNPFLLVVPASDNHQRGYLQDFIPVRRGLTLSEFQLYAVEQWVVDRARPTSLIVVSTNDPAHKIIVDILTPKAETAAQQSAIWERSMLKARTDGARPKQTPLGFVLVVSLLGFRSDLTIVLLPRGDFALAQDALFTNINLRRLGCGGRSGLSLSDPSPAQQERLLATYRLPNVASNMRVFTLTVLGLIKLVQSALALFNLGPLANDPKGLLQPDGLLCDTTVDGLVAWQIEVAEPLLQRELGENILSSATLAALLSTVISVRCRFLTMGVHHVPNDPFQNRGAFLLAYESFMKSTRNPPDAHYLSAAGIHHFKQQYTRTTKESLKRAIRHRLDDIRGDGNTAASNKASACEDETADILAFINAIQTLGSGDVQSVTTLWRGKYKKDELQDRKGSMPRAHGDDQVEASSQISSDSEDETGLGSKIIRGVSRRTKKIGGGVTGLLDISGNRHAAAYIGRDEAVKGKGSPSGLSSLLEQPTRSQSLNLDSYMPPYMTSAEPSPSGVPEGPSDLGGSAANGSKDEDQHGSTLRPVHMRRSVTDHEVHSMVVHTGEPAVAAILTRPRRHSFDSQRSVPRFEEVMSARSMKVDIELRLSHYELRKREAQLAKLVEALTAIDNTYEAALMKLSPAIRQRAGSVRELQTQSKHLTHHIEIFTGTSNTNLAPGRRGRDVSTDSTMLATVDADKEAVLNLSISSERLTYAQTILEEKVKEAQDLEHNLIAKIGGSEVLLNPVQARQNPPPYVGSLVKGLQDFVDAGSRGRHGTRRLLDVLSLWSSWLAYLRGRVRSYL